MWSRTVCYKPFEAISSTREISEFGCKSKLRVKAGLVRDIVRDLNTNISKENILEENDFDKGSKEIMSDKQCPLSNSNLNYEPVPVKDHGSGLEHDICLTQPKQETFRQLELKTMLNLKRMDCHTRSQRNTEIKLKLNSDIDCHTQPKLDDKKMLFQQVMLNKINNKISPKNKKIKTPVKTKINPTSIDLILKPSPKAKSIRKPSKPKVRDIIREFEGKFVNNTSKSSPLRKERNGRVGRKVNFKRFEVPSNQPDIRTFMDRSCNRDMSPNADRVNDH